jgi:glycogen(starch) synthase
MRILIISAFYPPHVIGGWEQLVQDINSRLRKRGHTTHVLTSDYGLNKQILESGVDRALTLESDLFRYNPYQFLSYKTRLDTNLKVVQLAINNYEPDIIFIHVMWNLSKGVAWIAEQFCPGRVVYYIANNWPYALDPHTAYWRDNGHNALHRLVKRILSPLPLKVIEHEVKSYKLKFEHVLCVSHALKEDLVKFAGIVPSNIQVISNGVETDLFVPLPESEKSKEQNQSLLLLYAGSLVPHKGVHTAIEAMAILANRSDAEVRHIKLTIAGSGNPDYENYLQRLVEDANLGDRIQFLGRIPREEMPELFQKHDVLIFPSIWEEPLARVMQEAMASGLVVIGTLTGGSGELLVEGETGLTFEPNDLETLVNKIMILSKDPKLYSKLSIMGRERVLLQFNLDRMIDEIENYLSNL